MSRSDDDDVSSTIGGSGGGGGGMGFLDPRGDALDAAVEVAEEPVPAPPLQGLALERPDQPAPRLLLRRRLLLILLLVRVVRDDAHSGDVVAEPHVAGDDGVREAAGAAVDLQQLLPRPAADLPGGGARRERGHVADAPGPALLPLRELAHVEAREVPVQRAEAGDVRPRRRGGRRRQSRLHHALPLLHLLRLRLRLHLLLVRYVRGGLLLLPSVDEEKVYIVVSCLRVELSAVVICCWGQGTCQRV